MRARIQKWGNSQGLRVAKPLLEAANFVVGEEIELFAEAGQITLRPAVKRKAVRIQDLAARMPKDAKLREEGFGQAVGKETW